MTEPEETAIDPQTEALLQMADAMSKIAESVAGYRASLEAMDFSPTAAETMAMQFHTVLIASSFGLRM